MQITPEQAKTIGSWVVIDGDDLELLLIGEALRLKQGECWVEVEPNGSFHGGFIEQEGPVA